MSADIGPGDFVECVDASPASQSGYPALVAGRLYVVRSISDSFTRPGEQIVRLMEMKLPIHPLGHEIGWWSKRFRPIYRPKPNAFDQYLRAPNKQKEDA